MATTKKDDLEKSNTGLILISVIVSVLIVGIWLVNLFLMKDLDPVKRGTFGDMFGSTNALFSGFAFAGIILTIFLQSKELTLQRQELKDTRDELKRSATAQENSEHSLRRQAENLKISAKLTALNTLVTYYSDLEKSLISAYANKGITEAALKRDQYVKRIEEILETKENS